MDKIKIRPTLSATIIRDDMTEIERFQNKTLRPVLKLQHNIFVLLFNTESEKHKTNMKLLSILEQKIFIKNLIQKNLVLKNQFLGIVIGMFTQGELEIYLKNTAEHNKRIINMIVQRIESIY